MAKCGVKEHGADGTRCFFYARQKKVRIPLSRIGTRGAERNGTGTPTKPGPLQREQAGRQTVSAKGAIVRTVGAATQDRPETIQASLMARTLNCSVRWCALSCRPFPLEGEQSGHWPTPVRI